VGHSGKDESVIGLIGGDGVKDGSWSVDASELDDCAVSFSLSTAEPSFIRMVIGSSFSAAFTAFAMGSSTSLPIRMSFSALGKVMMGPMEDNRGLKVMRLRIPCERLISAFLEDSYIELEGVMGST
jgi:hypothetical protein